MRTRVPMLMLVLALIGGDVIYAQSPLPVSAVMSAASEADASAVRLLVGRSTIIDVGTAIARVSLTSADVADALVTSPNQLLVNGKMPGTISMFVWDRGGAIRRYEVVVQRDLARLGDQMRQLFPGESIAVQSNGRDLVLSGMVSSKDMAEKAVNVAAGYVDKKEEIVNLLQIREGAMSNQVLLRVRFAEVSRNALTELGASIFTSPTGVKNTLVRTTTQQFSAPGYTDLQYTKAGSSFGSDVASSSGKFTFGDFLNLFLFSEKYDLGLMVRALQNKGLFQSLAEPNLVAESGKEASFLAGGEFPIPVAQSSGSALAITVQFKEFGIRLNFTPTVVGHRVHLKVRPEVSSLDFNNAVVLQGFRIPALTTRRTETELELNDGQTFAIAGLMNNTVQQSMQKIPGIGDIPILGELFKSRAAQKDHTELVVMITPQILPASSVGVAATLPRIPEPFLQPLPDKKLLEPPPPAFNAPKPSTFAAPAADPAAPSAAAAAATMSALTPAGPKIVRDAPASPATPAGVTRPLTPQEMKVIERARKEEREQKAADDRAREAEAKRFARQAEIDQRTALEAKAQRDKAAREQAKKDAVAAKKAAEIAARQAEQNRRQQKALDEAAAKLKAAEAAYQAELAKKNKAAAPQQ